MTRRRGFRIFGPKSTPYRSSLDDPDSARSSDELLGADRRNAGDDTDSSTATNWPSKKRRACCVTFRTPNSSRFRNNIHSRILQRFPFLIEMFYWVINYAFYRMTSILSQQLFAKSGIWQVAQSHGIAVLQVEEFSWLSFLFPIREKDVQDWFMNGHQDALTVLNRTYALIHIPGTVG